MKKYKEFPYPLITHNITVYGRIGCPYCDKMKSFLKKVYTGADKKKVVYHDIFNIIDSGQAKDVNDFKKKMKPFIGDYSTVPMVFLFGDFIGGYDNFCASVSKIIESLNKKNQEKIFDVLRVNKELNLNKKVKSVTNKINKLGNCDKKKKS